MLIWLGGAAPVAPLALKLCANIYSVGQNKLGANYFFIVILRLSSSDLNVVVFVCENISHGKKTRRAQNGGGGKTARNPEPGHSSGSARACLTSGSA